MQANPPTPSRLEEAAVSWGVRLPSAQSLTPSSRGTVLRILRSPPRRRGWAGEYFSVLGCLLNPDRPNGPVQSHVMNRSQTVLSQPHRLGQLGAENDAKTCPRAIPEHSSHCSPWD